jgi:hypothetical protein
MNSYEQVLWANKLRTDEVVLREIKQQYELLNAIFLDAVQLQLGKLRKEKCRGCEVDHPSQRRHECLMMPEEEEWILYGTEAVKQVIVQHIVSKHFVEATRVMKLNPHNEVIEHFKTLTKDPETTADFLKDLKDTPCLPEYQNILGYLKYWNEEH